MDKQNTSSKTYSSSGRAWMMDISPLDKAQEP